MTAEQEMPPKFDLYVYEVDGHDDLVELGDVLRKWARPRGRRFSLMRSIPRAEAALLARRAPGDRAYLDVERLATVVSDALAATTEGTDWAEAPEPSDEPGSPYVMRLTNEIIARLAADSRPATSQPHTSDSQDWDDGGDADSRPEQPRPLHSDPAMQARCDGHCAGDECVCPVRPEEPPE